MRADGYSLDIKRTEVQENDIPDIIARFNNLEQEKTRKRTDQSFFVPLEEIRSNDYDLSFNKYKRTENVVVDYPSSEEILANIEKLNQQIEQETSELRKLLEL